MESFFASQAGGYCVNQAEFVGHSFSLREAVGLRDAYRPASAAQIAQMESLARRALEAGAWGVSFGLDYCPGCAFQGVEALGRLAAKMGGLCPIHTRLFTMYDMYSISEAALLALNAGVQVQVSHLVYQYPLAHLLDEAFEMLEFAQRRGARIACDSGMYTHFAAPLGSATFDLDNMEICDWKFDELLVSTGPHKGEWMTEALYRKLRKEAPDTEVVCFSGEDDAVAYAFTRDYVMPSTDAGNYEPGQGHPQAAASFPLFFRVLVREKRQMSWPEAVRRATLLPAETMGLKRKGRLARGHGRRPRRVRSPNDRQPRRFRRHRRPRRPALRHPQRLDRRPSGRGRNEDSQRPAGQNPQEIAVSALWKRLPARFPRNQKPAAPPQRKANPAERAGFAVGFGRNSAFQEMIRNGKAPRKRFPPAPAPPCSSAPKCGRIEENRRDAAGGIQEGP